MKVFTFSFAAFATACTSSPSGANDPDLQRTLAARYTGDRTGACIAAAVVEGDGVHRASLCADAAHPRPVDGAFEIGSVSKTMTGALLADMIDQHKIALTDPIANYLPPGTTVPTFQGAPILVEHLVTHTAGLPRLPSRMPEDNADDPYAHLDATTMIASLADVTSPQAPGAKWAYSNFGFMLLSYIVSTLAGSDFETVAHARLFAPLHMDHAYVDHAPAGVSEIPGHRSTGEITSAWHFTPELAGVGGVRATLDDVIRYAQAQLGHGDAAVFPPLLPRSPAMTRPCSVARCASWSASSIPTCSGTSTAASSCVRRRSTSCAATSSAVG